MAYRLLLIAFSLWVIPLWAINQPAPDSADAIPQEIRIVTLKGPTGIAMMNILEQKYLLLSNGRKIPLKIEIAGTPDIIDARFISHQVDAATMPVSQAARLYNRGIAVQLAGVNIWGDLYVVSSDKKIAGWADLKGKRVFSTGKGATPDFVFRNLAQLNCLKVDQDVTLDYRYGQIELAQLLIGGKIALACLPEPFVTQVLAKQPNLSIVMDLQKEWSTQYGKTLRISQGGIVLSTEFSQKYPTLARSLLHAYATSCADLVSDPRAPVRIAALNLGIDAASLKAAIPRLNILWEDAGSARKSVEQFLNICLSFDKASIGGTLPGDSFYFTQ